MSNKKLAKEVEDLLELIYFDPANKGSYGGVDRLLKAAKEVNDSIKISDVKTFLKALDTYTLYRDARYKFIRQPIKAPSIDYQWQTDLVVIPGLARYNDGYVNILTCIDVFSRFAWAIPLKTKTGKEIVQAFQQIFTDWGRKPQKLNSDQGTEFTNAEFQNFLKRHNVHFFRSYSDKKAAMCERFNRTLKTRMWRYFEKHNTKRYIDILPKLMESYNNSIHRIIGIAPSRVTEANSGAIKERVEKIWQKDRNKVKSKSPKFFVNEPVRLSSEKLKFEKGYTGNWTVEILYVDKIYAATKPFMYRIRDNNGEVLKGRFYEHELQSVLEPADKEYKIEKIVARRHLRGKRPEVLIKWLGYPDSANTWEPESSVRQLL